MISSSLRLFLSYLTKDTAFANVIGVMRIHNPTSADGSNTAYPKTFRIPQPGKQDPYFGLSRSWYYNAEVNGQLSLIRLRQKGKSRGVTLIDFSQVESLINNNMTKGQENE